MVVPVLLITGDEEAVLTEAIQSGVKEALAGEDRSLGLEELNEVNYRLSDGSTDFSPGPLINAVRTPSFLTAHKVVLGRHIGRFVNRDQIDSLIGLINEGLEDTRLILVWERGIDPKHQKLSPVPKALLEAVTSAGGKVVSCSIGRGREANDWLTDRLNNAGVRFDDGARRLIIETVGEDRARVVGLIATLVAVFGSGAEITLSEVTPYIGEPGQVPPWELTDAIDSGDIARSIDRLHRMMNAGGRHPLGILAVLYGHYVRFLRLDGVNVTSDEEAAELLGIKAFPARKALGMGRRMGGEKIARAVRLLAEADLNLRGKTACQPELVVEVLVARLASANRR